MKQSNQQDVGNKYDVAFPRELGRKIVKAGEIRHESDYDEFNIASKEVTIHQIETAEQLIRMVSEYLSVVGVPVNLKD